MTILLTFIGIVLAALVPVIIVVAIDKAIGKLGAWLDKLYAKVKSYER